MRGNECLYLFRKDIKVLKHTSHDFIKKKKSYLDCPGIYKAVRAINLRRHYFQLTLNIVGLF